MNVIEAYEKPHGVEVMTSLYATFIPDDWYLPVPTDKGFVIMVNQVTYEKLRTMTYAEMQSYVMTLREFRGDEQ